MIVECYSADVYCDDADHAYGDPGSAHNPCTYTGKNKRETDRERRTDGWVKANGRDICPDCVRRIRDAILRRDSD